jgi:hypothetical protein
VGSGCRVGQRQTCRQRIALICRCHFDVCQGVKVWPVRSASHCHFAIFGGWRPFLEGACCGPRQTGSLRSVGADRRRVCFGALAGGDLAFLAYGR